MVEAPLSVMRAPNRSREVRLLSLLTHPFRPSSLMEPAEHHTPHRSEAAQSRCIYIRSRKVFFPDHRILIGMHSLAKQERLTLLRSVSHEGEIIQSLGGLVFHEGDRSESYAHYTPLQGVW
jgi:hypothetical protein